MKGLILKIRRFPANKREAEHAAVNRSVTGSSPVWGAKKSKSKDLDFFIHCESNGISPRVSVYIIKGGDPPLYLITPLGVYQKVLSQ